MKRSSLQKVSKFTPNSFGPWISIRIFLSFGITVTHNRKKNTLYVNAGVNRDTAFYQMTHSRTLLYTVLFNTVMLTFVSLCKLPARVHAKLLYCTLSSQFWLTLRQYWLMCYLGLVLTVTLKYTAAKNVGSRCWTILRRKFSTSLTQKL
jgi:hypothetical protein